MSRIVITERDHPTIEIERAIFARAGYEPRRPGRAAFMPPSRVPAPGGRRAGWPGPVVARPAT